MHWDRGRGVGEARVAVLALVDERAAALGSTPNPARTLCFFSDADSAPIPLPPPGETARMEAASDPKAKASTLVDEMKAQDPMANAAPTKMTPPAKPDPSLLEKELNAMVDANGQSPITGKISDPAGTKESKVGGDNLPALNADALMAAGKIAAAKTSATLAAAIVKFRTIASFKYGAGGKQFEGKSQEACQADCKNDQKCVSFSYNAKTSSCIASTGLIQYDLEYTFFAKKAQKVEGVAAFRKLGAMKFFAGKGDKSVKAFPGIQEAGCQSNCGKNADCTSFTYRKSDSMCLTSTQDIKYDADWSYHEKVGAAEMMAMKLKAESVASPAAAAAKPAAAAAPAKDNKAEDKALEAADESSLSSSQLAMLKDKKKSGSQANAKAILLDTVWAKTAQLTREEAARAEVAAQLQKQADAKADTENTFEKKGKATFKADLSSTKNTLDAAVAKASKEGWTTSELAAKSGEKSRESTQKNNQEAAATKLRTTTEEGLALTAQKELEARDAVADIESRKGLFKASKDNLKSLDAKNAAEIKKLQGAMGVAAQTLIDSKNTKDLDKAKAEAKAEKQKAADAARLIAEKNSEITNLDTKMTSLNTDKAAKATALGNADGKVKGTEQELAASTEDGKSALEKRLAEEQKSEKTMKEAAKTLDDQLAELAAKVTAGNSFISTTSTKKSQAEAALAAAKIATTTEQERLDQLANQGKVQMDDARFRKNQALSSEFKTKTKLADETKASLKFEEGDMKAKLKATDYKLKLTELEDSKKAQSVEDKMKTALKYKEVAAQKQKKVDDVVKEAQEDEIRSVKMLSDGKYAQVTAISVEQKASAAQTVSNAAALKATSEQKIEALGPAKQAAKEAAAAAKDKLDALKALFGSDEAGFKKAMAAFNSGKANLKKEQVEGELNAEQKLAGEKEKLAAEAAGLNGANLNKARAPSGSNEKGAAQAKSNEIKEKIASARKNQKDPMAGLLGEKQEKDKLAGKLSKDQAVERNTKNMIASAEEKDEQTKKVEIKQAAQEKTDKAKLAAEAKGSMGTDALQAAKILEQTKKDEAVRATMDESNTKNAAQAEVAKMKNRQAQEAAGSSNGIGCTAGSDGKALSLEVKETCTKNKAKELESTEKMAKTAGKNQLIAIQTAEKQTKSKEKSSKESLEKKDAKEAAATQEKASKEAEQKSTTDENNQKENKKKEMKTKDTAREVQEKEEAKKESATKSDAKMSQEERTKADAARESKTKNAEKASKSDEGGTKEKTAKEEKTAKQEKSTREQMDESSTKKNASMNEEAQTKASAEKDVKAIKQKEMQASQSEKATKEQSSKGRAEAATKQTAAGNQSEQTTKEVAQKKTAADSAAAASSEKQTKDAANEQAAKETKQKGAAAIQSQQENTNKANANEQAGKVPAIRL